MGVTIVGEVKIRSYAEDRDRVRVEDFERRCEVGVAERVSLLMDTMGDPICRIRNSPIYTMLVAEVEGELVGVIRGTVKVVTLRNPPSNRAKVGYILGLRVSPLHRRRGIAAKLVEQLKLWFGIHAVDCTYMATESHNDPSIALFVNKLGFHKFVTPSVFINAVTRSRPCRKPSTVEITKLPVEEAESLYLKYMGSADFFPHDIGAVLKNKLTLGTWIAYPQTTQTWDDNNNSNSSSSNGNNNRMSSRNWAMVSVWNSGEVFKLRLGRAPLYWRIYAKGSRWIARALAWLGREYNAMPVVPNLFEPFGFYFVYGVHKEGPLGGEMVRSLFEFVRDMAATTSGDCKVIVTEIGGCDAAALRARIPHSKWLSCPEDLWCVRPLLNANDALHKSTPSRALFVDPREV